MATVTAQLLIAAGLRRADMQDGPLEFIAHPASGGGEAYDLLNAAISELWDTLYEADSEGYAGLSVSAVTVAGTSTYPLTTIAADFYRLRGVDFLVDGLRYVDLDRINFADRNRYPVTGRPQGYATQGANLVLYPAPDGVYTLRFSYFPLPPTASANSDTFDLQGPWREFVELHFAIQCLEKEESDTSVLRQRCLEVASRIRSASKKRDSGKPVMVVDVQGDMISWSGAPWRIY